MESQDKVLGIKHRRMEETVEQCLRLFIIALRSKSSRGWSHRKAIQWKKTLEFSPSSTGSGACFSPRKAFSLGMLFSPAPFHLAQFKVYSRKHELATDILSTNTLAFSILSYVYPKTSLRKNYYSQ